MIHHVESNYELDREYDRKAREIVEDWNMKYEDKKKKVNALLKEYLCKIFNTDSAEKFYIY